MTDPLDMPPVLTERTVVCPTEGCPNAGIPLTLECAGTVVCGACSQVIPDDE